MADDARQQSALCMRQPGPITPARTKHAQKQADGEQASIVCGISEHGRATDALRTKPPPIVTMPQQKTMSGNQLHTMSARSLRDAVHLSADLLQDQVTRDFDYRQSVSKCAGKLCTHHVEDVQHESATICGNHRRTKTANAVLNCRP